MSLFWMKITTLYSRGSYVPLIKNLYGPLTSMIHMGRGTVIRVFLLLEQVERIIMSLRWLSIPFDSGLIFIIYGNILFFPHRNDNRHAMLSPITYPQFFLRLYLLWVKLFYSHLSTAHLSMHSSSSPLIIASWMYPS